MQVSTDSTTPIPPSSESAPPPSGLTELREIFAPVRAAKLKALLDGVTPPMTSQREAQALLKEHFLKSSSEQESLE